MTSFNYFIILIPAIFLFINLSIRYFEDLRKHRIIPEDPDKYKEYEEHKRCFRNFWYCLAAAALLAGILIGSFL
jgi:hypothetical protein